MAYDTPTSLGIRRPLPSEPAQIARLLGENADDTNAAIVALNDTYVELAGFPVSREDIERATFITDAEMTSGSAVLHSDSHTFTAADVGKTVGVRGAGPISTDYSVLANDGVLVTTIASVSGGNATLAEVATNTCSGEDAAFGFPIDAALVAADAAAAAAGGGKILIPAGRWITTVTFNITAGNGIRGAGRDLTDVYFVHTGPGTDDTASWVRSSGAYPKRVSVTDFTMDGQFFVATGPVGSNMKMLQVTQTDSSVVARMRIKDNPATAVGYDESTHLLIEDNIITNAGRLGPRASTGAGYSAIGITVGNSRGPSSYIIRGNFIDGGWRDDADDTNKNSKTGIHLEGIFSDSTDTGPAPDDKCIIEGNLITGCANGIRDSGSLGTLITGNWIWGCRIGVSLANKGSSGSRTPNGTIVTGNHIWDLIDPASHPGGGFGIQISTFLTTYTDHGRIIVIGNNITAAASHGVYLNGGGTGTNPPLQHVRVADNIISDCGGHAVYVRTGMKNIQIVSNTFISNCKDVASALAVFIESTTIWIDGRISGNSCIDYQAVPTQTGPVQIQGSASLTKVFIGDNGDDPVAVQSDTRLRLKNNTTTINANTTLATIANLTALMKAGVTYEFIARIHYTTSATAGIKFGLSVGDGATAEWWRAAAPTRLLQTNTLTVTGAASGGVVILQGWVTAGSADFFFGITAAQATSDPTDTTISTACRLSVTRITRL